MELCFECLCAFFALSTFEYSFFVDTQGSPTPILLVEVRWSLEA